MIYFDNGATTFPKPVSVVKAVNDSLQFYGANPGRSGHKMSIKSSEIIYKCRVNVAKLFDIDSPEKVIFTNNCTTALNYVIKGLLKKGDHVIVSSLEHNAVIRPLEHLKQSGVEYSIAEYVPYDNDKTLDNFRNKIKSNTKLIICTHASNVFGVKLPIERIAALCKIHGILFCVDAAQSAGVVPISLKNNYIDFLCTSGHKGLYGPMGTGILVINSDVQPDSIIQGGTGSQSSKNLQPDILPDKYESGTPNLPGIAGLNEGIKFVLNKTPQSILKREMHLSQVLYDGLSNIDGVILYTKRPEYEFNVPVISFNLKNLASEEVALVLDNKYGIAVRAGFHCAPMAHRFYKTDEIGTVRIVISSFNNVNQISYLINAVRSMCKHKKQLKKVAIDY